MKLNRIVKSLSKTKPERNVKLLFKIFFETLRLSAFTLGGGYVIIGLIKKRMVEELGWISEDEMMDLVSLSQACPGAIAVNVSLMLGYQLAGFWGAIASALGTVFPPLVIMTVLYYLYDYFINFKAVQFFMRGMQAGVAAVLADVVVTSCSKVFKSKNIFSIIIMVISFSAVMFFNVNAVWVVLAGGTIGVLIYFFVIKKSEKRKAANKEDEQ